jgi:hypothetical protein
VARPFANRPSAADLRPSATREVARRAEQVRRAARRTWREVKKPDSPGHDPGARRPLGVTPPGVCNFEQTRSGRWRHPLMSFYRLRAERCARLVRIPTKRATDSERRRPPIPIDGGQGFRRSRPVLSVVGGVIKSGGGAGVKRGHFGGGFAHGVSLQGEPVGVVNEAIENGVGERRVADGGVPGVDR